MRNMIPRAIALALPALILAGCSTVETTSVPTVDRSTYSDPHAAPILSQSGNVHSAIIGDVRDSGRTHIVAQGDTLYNISLRYGFEPSALATLNSITDPTTLRIGQSLRLPVSTKTPVTTASNNVRVSRITEPTPVTAPVTSVEPAPESPAAATKPVNNASSTSATPAETPAAKTEPAPAPAKVVPGTRMIWPANGKILHGFGENGKGLDIGGVDGDIVVSSGAGTVLFVGSNVKGYGNLVIIKHSDSVVTAYGHNRKIVVKTNDRVKAGQKIAEMGSLDGVAQLRFEVRERGKAVNPLDFLPPRK